jgi:hypothetical protein
MSESITLNTAFCAVVNGKTKTDRKLSAVDQTRSMAALAVVASFGGKTGKAAGAALAMPAALEVANECANANYRSVADVMAAITGKTHTVNRARFHALPAEVDDMLSDLALTKNGGYRVDKKTQARVPTSERLTLLTLKAWLIDVIRAQEQIRADRDAARAEEAKRIANEVQL